MVAIVDMFKNSSPFPPFLQLGLTNNLFYTINGALLIMAFLISRVLFVPIAVSILAAQYHQWDIFKALASMTRLCHFCNFLQFSLQFYWFLLLVRLAANVVRGWTDRGREKRHSDTLRTERTSVLNSSTKKCE